MIKTHRDHNHSRLIELDYIGCVRSSGVMLLSI